MTKTFVMEKGDVGIRENTKRETSFCVAFNNAQSEADACSVGAREGNSNRLSQTQEDSRFNKT